MPRPRVRFWRCLCSEDTVSAEDKCRAIEQALQHRVYQLTSPGLEVPGQLKGMQALPSKKQVDMRADAHRNRARIISAGNDVFMDQGPSAPLDWVATRAGVGNATLYRHFPTREKLIQEIVLDNVQRTEDLAAIAVAEEKDPWRALVRFTNEAVFNRVVALLPVLWPFVASDDEFHQAIMGASETVENLLAAAQKHGDLRNDVATGDFILTLATVSRPLPSVPNQLSATIRHRHIALLIDGMRASGSSTLPGHSMSAQQVIDQLDAGDRP